MEPQQPTPQVKDSSLSSPSQNRRNRMITVLIILFALLAFGWKVWRIVENSRIIQQNVASDDTQVRKVDNSISSHPEVK